MKLGRITKGSGYLGPEYYGCIGTGRRPLIYKSKVSGKFFIGPEMDVQETINKYKNHIGRRKVGNVFIFKGRKAAVAKFQELCDKVTEWNSQERQRAATLRDKARSGDMAAFIELGMG